MKDRFEHPRFDFGDEPKPPPSGAAGARDEALKLVLKHSKAWAMQTLVFIDQMDRGWVGTAEDLRLVAEKAGEERPHHHNAWGALINIAIRKWLLRPTGELRHMRTIKSHARRTMVYRRTAIRL